MPDVVISGGPALELARPLRDPDKDELSRKRDEWLDRTATFDTWHLRDLSQPPTGD